MGFKKSVVTWALRNRIGRKRKAGYSRGAKRQKTIGRVSKRRSYGRKGLYTKMLRQPVPDRIFTKLRYCSRDVRQAINFGGGINNSSFIWQTSVYDPQTAAGGHQPMWRDQVAVNYKRYRVRGIGYRYLLTAPNTQQMCTMWIHCSSDPTLDTLSQTLSERRNVRCFPIKNAGVGVSVVKGYISTAKMYGLSQADYLADEDFIGNVGANPAKMAYIKEYFESHHANTAEVDYHVVLTFYVEYIDPIQVGGS